MLSIIWPAWVSLNPDMPSVTIFTAPYSEEDLHSHQLLCRAAMLLTGRDPGSIARGPWGKPCFPNLPMLHFSISHSGEWWLCAFSDRPVGIDLQRCVSFVSPKTLSRRFFHPQEDSFLLQNSYEYFYDLWTAKENWVKFTGRGFYDEPESFSVVAEDGSFPSAEGTQLQHIPFRDGYSLCVCAEVIGTIIFRELN